MAHGIRDGTRPSIDYSSERNDSGIPRLPPLFHRAIDFGN